MLISFTQTYGNNRKRLLDIYSRDKRLHEFKNLCDINFYSFHNSTDATVEYFESLNTVKNTQILRFNNITYTECIKELMTKLEELGCTHFFFSQDDTFSKDNDDVDFNEVIDCVKSHESNFMYCFFYNQYYTLEKSFCELKTLKLYTNYTYNVGMDDQPFICTFDVLKKIYDESYFSIGDIWRAERFLCKKFLGENMPRYFADKSLFGNYNLIGRTSWNKKYWKEELIKRGLI